MKRTHFPSLRSLAPPGSAAHRALALGSVPVIWGGATWLTIRGLESGVPDTHLLPPIIAVSALAIALLEQVIPFEPEWNREHGDVLTDFFHNTISSIVVPVILRLAFFAIFAPLGAALARAVGASLWPSHWPIWA